MDGFVRVIQILLSVAGIIWVTWGVVDVLKNKRRIRKEIEARKRKWETTEKEN